MAVKLVENLNTENADPALVRMAKDFAASYNRLQSRMKNTMAIRDKTMEGHIRQSVGKDHITFAMMGAYHSENLLPSLFETLPVIYIWDPKLTQLTFMKAKGRKPDPI